MQTKMRVKKEITEKKVVVPVIAAMNKLYN